MKRIDARCHCSQCTEPRTYVCRHRCSNCGSEFEAVHRFGDRASANCPHCGEHRVFVHRVDLVPEGAA